MWCRSGTSRSCRHTHPARRTCWSRKVCRWGRYHHHGTWSPRPGWACRCPLGSHRRPWNLRPARQEAAWADPRPGPRTGRIVGLSRQREEEGQGGAGRRGGAGSRKVLGGTPERRHSARERRPRAGGMPRTRIAACARRRGTVSEGAFGQWIGRLNKARHEKTGAPSLVRVHTGARTGLATADDLELRGRTSSSPAFIALEMEACPTAPASNVEAEVADGTEDVTDAAQAPQPPAPRRRPSRPIARGERAGPCTCRTARLVPLTGRRGAREAGGTGSAWPDMCCPVRSVECASGSCW